MNKIPDFQPRRPGEPPASYAATVASAAGTRPVTGFSPIRERLAHIDAFSGHVVVGTSQKRDGGILGLLTVSGRSSASVLLTQAQIRDLQTALTELDAALARAEASK